MFCNTKVRKGDGLMISNWHQSLDHLSDSQLTFILPFITAHMEITLTFRRYFLSSISTKVLQFDRLKQEMVRHILLLTTAHGLWPTSLVIIHLQAYTSTFILHKDLQYTMFKQNCSVWTYFWFVCSRTSSDPAIAVMKKK